MNTEFFILCFSSLFTLINPIGIVPIFIAMTDEYSKKERDVIAFKSVLFAFCILILFGVIGEFIFSFYNITIHGFRIAGGMLLLKISFDMIESKRSRTRTTPMEEKAAEEKNEIAYTPLAIPLIAGPGSIASIMILSSESSNWNAKITLFVSLGTVLLITFLTLKLSKYLTKTFGRAGLRIMQRIMGLILMVISIEFILKGIKDSIQNWNL
jgi:multiple antibiotic resistance protein|tara:strand:- start:47 stop:679 length:633 start_codon:yes stop_codon:yes gene_type:complete